MTDTTLPLDFAESAIDRFDRLRDDGLLFYTPVAGEVVEANHFHFEFKISPSIARKPVLAANAPERRGRGGPFVDPDPRFVVGRPGPDHVVELSMHAMFRPHYVLHTRLFAPQTDDLDRSDWAATWALMTALAVKPSSSPMMLYNCGYDGGASQGHKHVQVFAEPAPGFALFPEESVRMADHTAANGMNGSNGTCITVLRHPTVPFQHFVVRLDLAGDADVTTTLDATYRALLARVRAAHATYAAAHPDDTSGSDGDGEDAPPASTTAYNVVLTPRWMCLIPRRRGGREGTGAGALGMLGLLWLRDERERAHWTALGMTEHLVWMGLPWEDGPKMS